MDANVPGTRRIHLGTALQQGKVHAFLRDEGAGLPADVEGRCSPD